VSILVDWWEYRVIPDKPIFWRDNPFPRRADIYLKKHHPASGQLPCLPTTPINNDLTVYPSGKSRFRCESPPGRDRGRKRKKPPVVTTEGFRFEASRRLPAQPPIYRELPGWVQIQCGIRRADRINAVCSKAEAG
jgi:hypothetical protein